jgi:hypothetical protein
MGKRKTWWLVGCMSSYANHRVILLSTWVYELLEMPTICLGMLFGLLHLEMTGWGVIYGRQHKTSRWRQATALYGTPDSMMVHRTVWCPLSGAPSRWTDTAGDRWRTCFLHLTVQTSHWTVRWSSLYSAT